MIFDRIIRITLERRVKKEASDKTKEKIKKLTDKFTDSIDRILRKEGL